MKIRNIALILVMVLVLSTFSGCGLLQLEQKAEILEDEIERKADAFEDKLEEQIEGAANKYEPALSDLQAESVALKHAGVCVADVDRIYSEFEIDDGIKQYDVKFYLSNVEYEYSINADSGEIISFEIDR